MLEHVKNLKNATVLAVAKSSAAAWFSAITKMALIPSTGRKFEGNCLEGYDASKKDVSALQHAVEVIDSILDEGSEGYPRPSVSLGPQEDGGVWTALDILIQGLRKKGIEIPFPYKIKEEVLFYRTSSGRYFIWFGGIFIFFAPDGSEMCFKEFYLPAIDGE